MILAVFEPRRLPLILILICSDACNASGSYRSCVSASKFQKIRYTVSTVGICARACERSVSGGISAHAPAYDAEAVIRLRGQMSGGGFL